MFQHGTITVISLWRIFDGQVFTLLTEDLFDLFLMTSPHGGTVAVTADLKFRTWSISRSSLTSSKLLISASRLCCVRDPACRPVLGLQVAVHKLTPCSRRRPSRMSFARISSTPSTIPAQRRRRRLSHHPVELATMSAPQSSADAGCARGLCIRVEKREMSRVLTLRSIPREPSEAAEVQEVLRGRRASESRTMAKPSSEG